MRLDGTIRHGLDFNVGNANSWTTSVAFGPLVVSGGGGVQSDWNVTDASSMAYIKNKPTIPAAQVQSNWNESDTSSKAFIQNKPTIPTVPTNVSAFTNDAGYLNNNFCPIIEDTRSSAVVAITGDAPFANLNNRQQILLHSKYMNTGSAAYTLNLTLSNNTTTGAKNIKYVSRTNSWNNANGNLIRSGVYLHLIYDQEKDAWLLDLDYDTTYEATSNTEINTGTSTVGRLITPKLFHDNAYIVETTYSSGSLKANKFYDFGTVSSALSFTLDATNDLVSNALNFYALRFIAGADNISITFPTGVIVDDTPTINTGDYVEIMINKYGTNYYASIKVWQAQLQNS